MKKERIWTIVVIVGALAILGVVLTLTIVNEWSWKAFVITSISEASLFFIGGFIYVIIKFRKRPIEQQEVNIKEAVEFTKHEILHETDNPDNLKIEEIKLRRIGAEGKEPTPILIVYGKGTEMGQNRVIIRNMNNYKKEKTSLIDPIKEEIIEGIFTMAEYPPAQITEEIKQSLEYGIPTTYIKRNIPSSTSQRKEIEKQEAEKQSVM